MSWYEHQFWVPSRSGRLERHLCVIDMEGRCKRKILLYLISWSELYLYADTLEFIFFAIWLFSTVFCCNNNVQEKLVKKSKLYKTETRVFFQRIDPIKVTWTQGRLNTWKLSKNDELIQLIQVIRCIKNLTWLSMKHLKAML